MISIQDYIENAPEREPQHISNYTSTISDELIQNRVKSTMERAQKMIIEAGEGQKHENCLKAGKLIGGLVGGELLANNEGEVFLINAINSNPTIKDLKGRIKDAMDGLRYGIQEPISAEGIEQEINEWRAKQPQKETTTKRSDKSNQRFPTINFFTVSEDKDGNSKTRISPHNLIECLIENKFYRFSTSKGERKFIRDIENIVEFTEVDQVTDFIFRLCKTGIEPHGLSYPEMFDTLTRNRQYICESFYARLTYENEFSFVKDTATSCFLYFTNGFLEITKHGWELKPYSQLKGYIWKEQIIAHKFNPELIEDRTILPMESDFAKFLLLISEGYINEKEEFLQEPQIDGKRIQSLMAIIGYCLHYYHNTKMKAIVLTDSSLSDSADGRSGKTLLTKSIAQLRPSADISGKDFQMSNNHRFQAIKPNDQVIIFNDITKKFNLESIYTGITEGYEVNPKGKNPYKVIAKTMITSNSTLKLEGGSDRDRVHEFELTNYFSERHSPLDEFGKWFFSSDWKQAEWQYFFATMTLCIKTYLATGLETPYNPNLQLRKLKETTSKEFLSWVKDCNDSKTFYPTTETLEQFQLEFPDMDKLRGRTFQKWFANYADCIHDAYFERPENKVDGKRGFYFKKGTPPASI
ncbi:primase-helicase family protein [Sediminitomix flava]|uniref:SF3 helicase domain-containing protein n=1 Tax=Sediminitomix flava TaxID=379075 RepID=A0A315ZA89_SEDFL|nr:primase-helicase family protein [Sediminitomix flava]PWJ42250.1 hypothetical protein BC781_103502 [Sediminitomix flava]